MIGIQLFYIAPFSQKGQYMMIKPALLNYLLIIYLYFMFEVYLDSKIVLIHLH